MLLPDRQTHRQIGLVDFQDAGQGPIAYDLASLCEEVRREGAFETLPHIIKAYLNEASQLPDHPYFNSLQKSASTTPSACAALHAHIHQACILFSVQRHMRILGLLARKLDTPQTPHTHSTALARAQTYLPRIEVFLHHLLKNPALSEILHFCKSYHLNLST